MPKKYIFQVNRDSMWKWVPRLIKPGAGAGGIISRARPVANYTVFLRTISFGPESLVSRNGCILIHILGQGASSSWLTCVLRTSSILEESLFFFRIQWCYYESVCVCASVSICAGSCVTRACTVFAELQWCQTHNDFLLAVNPWGPMTCYRSDQLAFTPLINTDTSRRTWACTHSYPCWFN